MQTIDESQYNIVKEGKASILFPKDNEVFYNPVQEFNRDMSIAAIRTWSEIYIQEKRDRLEKKLKNSNESSESRAEKLEHFINTKTFTILEALAATGLRSVRYAKEIPNLKRIVANDIDPDAVESIKRNIKYNELSEDLIQPNLGDAMKVMYDTVGQAEKYDVVDLDPYGTAMPFIDGAIQAVNDGGLLCVTCTDLAILSGASHPETCFGKYGGTPLKNTFPHEMALRLVLQSLQTTAGRYGRHIVPLMSCSIDFYLRVFVRVFTSRAAVKLSASKMAMVYECTGCHAYAIQPLGKVWTAENGQPRFSAGSGPPVNEKCDHCDNTHQCGGPTWGAAIHDKAFVSRMLQHVKENEANYGTHRRMQGMMAVINEEIEYPFYFTMGKLNGTLHCNTMPMDDFRSAILNAGYKVSLSHCGPDTIKTDAPWDVIWDIMRVWVKKTPIQLKNVGEHSPARKILAKEPTLQVDFTRHPDATPESRKIKLVRYQVNPTPNWGPKARAGKKRKVEE